MKPLGQQLASIVSIAASLGLVAFAAATAAALSNPDDFCTGDPCLITSSKTADAGITLDFGSRAVVLSDTLEIGDLQTGVVGSLTILAGSFAIVGTGQIKGNGGSGQAGDITIDVPGDIQVDGTRSIGAFRMPGNDGGSVSLFAGGNVFGAGKFNLDRDGIIGSGGDLLIQAGGIVNLSGDIAAQGGLQGFGGTIDINSVGDLTLSGQIVIRGGDSGGGSIDIFSEGSATIGPINMSAGGDAGDAGLGDILALGNLTITGILEGSGADNGENCGDAADLDLTADGDITILADFRMRGRGLDCSGGFLTIDGDAVTIVGELDLSATGTEGIGGDLDISGVTNLQITGNLRVDGPDGAGDVLLASDDALVLDGDLQANGFGTFGSGASLIDIDAGGDLTVRGSVDASGGGQGSGGDVTLDACTLLQTATSIVDASAAGGLITVIGSEDVTLDGTFVGEPTVLNAIEIRYGTLADPPDISGATFNIPPTLVLNPLLVPCSLCSSTTICDDGNPCTDDSCDPFTGCQIVANTDPCDDGNACTTNDFCAFSLCISFSNVVCDDGNPCTDDFCDPAVGCDTTFNTTPCDDGEACTENDACTLGSCVGSQIDCEDGNPCTDNSCLDGSCLSSDNTLPCEDGDACTTSDVCVAGTCVGGAPPICSDPDPCTSDSCDSAIGCVFDPIAGCQDRDGDGIIDDQDNCTTLDWSADPQTPPNQHPAKLRLILKNLSKPDGEQGILMKGFFNVAQPALPIAPQSDGIHFVLEDSAGVFYEVDIPGGAVGAPQNCGARDGWSTVVNTTKSRWKYSNKSGALPPACTPGSARGISTFQLKDLRAGGKSALQVKIKAKKGSVDRSPVLPLTMIQIDLALGAEPSAGMASVGAIDGQCAEAIISGNPINATAPIPFCKQKFRDAVLDKVTCKGE